MISGLQPDWSVGNFAHEIPTCFYSALAVEALYPQVAIVPTIRTIFSLAVLVVVVDT
jgi:hypothetical protein